MQILDRSNAVFAASLPPAVARLKSRGLQIRRQGATLALEKAGVKVLKSDRNESLLETTISQGLNRQIRRMLARAGVRVKSLKRIAIGKLPLGNLPACKFRERNLPKRPGCVI